MERAMTPSVFHTQVLSMTGAPSLVLAAMVLLHSTRYPAYRSALSWISLNTYRLHCFDAVRWMTAAVNQQVGLQSAMRVRRKI